MPEPLSSIIDPNTLLALEPAELGGVVLEFLNSLPVSEKKGLLNPHVFAPEFGPKGYPDEFRERITLASMEAWGWLNREGW